jgi:glutathione synthase/RimK-type ligase-like ATP-grasp enzyme
MTAELLSTPETGTPSAADRLNRGCACRTLDPAGVRRELEREPGLAGLGDEIARTRPHLFSPTAVFVSPAHLERMAALVAAVEDIVSLTPYQDAALAAAPAIAQRHFGPRGAFLGFDFHLGARGPQLIEINTNAGGALLVAALARAQEACCESMDPAAAAPAGSLAGMEQTLFDMFDAEWRSQRGAAPIGRVAIVDDDPAAQYLYPEFRLFERLFAQHGVDAAIADAHALEWRDGRLRHAGAPVDMVYNRLTDFYLEAPAHAALRSAYEAGAVVLTPHPRAHALYADKRNLAVLGDPDALAALGAAAPTREALLACVPRAERVNTVNAERLWAERKKLFFKPAAGYAGKGAYRGEKLTRRVWEEILASDYVAQAFVAPPARVLDRDGAATDLKFDVRAYAYAGRIQMLAARLYAGQTTNFRTPGGGFAPVFVVANGPAREHDPSAPEMRREPCQEASRTD